MRVKRLLLPAILGLGLTVLWLAGSRAFSVTAGTKPGRLTQVTNNTIHVDADVTGGAGDGSTWNDAFATLQHALDVAQPGDEIWVAEGLYTPTHGTGCTATFQLPPGVALYGGFAASETAREERDWKANVTVLSGDLDGDDATDANGILVDTTGISGTNACHVITSSGVTETAGLDGFTITAGHAAGSGSDPAAPDNRGGGMYNENSSPTVANVVFSGNAASRLGDAFSLGGAVFNNNSSPRFERVTFLGNSADRGGGMYNLTNSSPTLVNVVFSGNYAEDRGGGMRNNDHSDPVLINVTFTSNSVSLYNGAGLSNHDHSNPVLTNCIFYSNTIVVLPNQIANTTYSNPIISYSDIQGSNGSGDNWDDTLGTDGGGNIDQNPHFVDADGPDGVPGTLDDDLHLENHSSPCVDAGTTSGSPDNDFDGEQRPTAFGVDMGADELVMSADCYDFEDPVSVGVEDMDFLASHWRSSSHAPYDNDGDGMVTVIDLLSVAAQWNQSCP